MQRALMRKGRVLLAGSGFVTAWLGMSGAVYWFVVAPSGGEPGQYDTRPEAIAILMLASIVACPTHLVTFVSVARDLRFRTLWLQSALCAPVSLIVGLAAGYVFSLVQVVGVPLSGVLFLLAFCLAVVLSTIAVARGARPVATSPVPLLTRLALGVRRTLARTGTATR